MSEKQGGTEVDLSLFPERDRAIIAVMDEIALLGGEEYAGGTKEARRNPVKPDTAPALTALANVLHPGRILEFGTARGYSGLCLLLGSRMSQLDTIEFDGEVAKEAQGNFERAGVDAQATVFPMDVEQFVAGGHGVDAGYNMLVIDHDKTHYNPDFQRVLAAGLLAPGCKLVVDNINDRRAECQDLVDFVAENYEYTIAQTQAGLLIADIF